MMDKDRVIDGERRLTSEKKALTAIVEGFDPVDAPVVHNIREWPGLDFYIAEVEGSTRVVDPGMYQHTGYDKGGMIYERIKE